MLSTLVLTLAIGAPLVKDKAAPKPTLIGEWRVETVDVGGNGGNRQDTTWTFSAEGKFTIGTNGAGGQSMTYKVDLTGSPMTVDLNNGGIGHSNLSIFRIEGDTLTLGVGHNQGVRPTNLSPGPGVTVWVMKRVKSRD